MSIHDHELDDPTEVCACGNVARVGKRTCYECDADLKDLYADASYQDSVDRLDRKKDKGI
jgi:hypothetical protein